MSWPVRMTRNAVDEPNLSMVSKGHLNINVSQAMASGISFDLYSFLKSPNLLLYSSAPHKTWSVLISI
jgi:hypothetical protein